MIALVWKIRTFLSHVDYKIYSFLMAVGLILFPWFQGRMDLGSLVLVSGVLLLFLVQMFRECEKMFVQRNELLERNSRLSQTLESRAEAIVVFNTSGIILSFNEGAELMFGFSSGEVLAKNVNHLFLVENKFEGQNVLVSLLSEVNNGNFEQFFFEGIGRSAAGRKFPVEIAVSQNQTICSAFIRNIEQRRILENQIQVESAIARLLSNVHAIVRLDSDIDGTLRAILKEICSALGWQVGHIYFVSEKDPNLLEASKIWYFEDEKRFENFRAVTEQTNFLIGEGLPGRVLRSEHSIWIADVIEDIGFARDKFSTDIVVRSAFGIPVHVKSKIEMVIELFSDEIQLENEALLKTVDAIGLHMGRVIERKRDEIELLRAKESAIDAARVKSEFLATISHEIRTPMNGILGMAQLLANSPLTLKQMDQVHIIQDSCQSLIEIINDVLDFSKLESSKVILEEKPFDIRRSVRDVYDLLSPKALEKEIGFEILLDGSLPEVVIGDETRFKQVLFNLSGNAIKFTDVGKVLVSGQLVVDQEGRVLMRFEVHDTGVGIPSDAIDKLFERFYQVESSSDRRSRGTGLGLAISKRLVEVMGGKIWVESKKGQGSTFFFTVKMMRGERNQVSERQKRDRFQIDSELGKKIPLSILSVDDNPINQDVISNILANMGYKPDLAYNGWEAIHCVDKKRYDLLLMDCHMPEMDGFEATRRLRKSQSSHVGQIVALTASTTKEDVEKCLAAGMDAVLAKPLVVGNLIELIQKKFSHNSDHSPDVPRIHAADSSSPSEFASGPDSVFDQEALFNLFLGDNDILMGTIRRFLEKKANYISELSQAIGQRDQEMLELKAHNVKGILGTFFAARARTMAEELETKGSQGNFEEAQEILGKLDFEMENLCSELRKLVRKTA